MTTVAACVLRWLKWWAQSSHQDNNSVWRRCAFIIVRNYFYVVDLAVAAGEACISISTREEEVLIQFGCGGLSWLRLIATASPQTVILIHSAAPHADWNWWRPAWNHNFSLWWFPWYSQSKMYGKLHLRNGGENGMQNNSISSEKCGINVKHMTQQLKSMIPVNGPSLFSAMVLQFQSKCGWKFRQCRMKHSSILHFL